MEPNYTTRILNYAIQTCGFYPLRPMQICLFDMQLTKARSAMLNLQILFKLDDAIDLELLAKAITDTLNNYDIFRCRFVFHPGTDDLCQRFDGEISPVTVEKISDADFELRKETLVEPYRLTNAPRYRIFIGVLFAREVDLRYRGKPPRRSPPKYSDIITEELLISADFLAEGNSLSRLPRQLLPTTQS